jgi:hypothetical protein
MTEKPAWAVLPNAKYIDLVMDSLKKNPAVWSAAGDAARDAARDAVWSAAWTAARGAAKDAARDTAWAVARAAVWDAAKDAAWTAAKDAARDTAWAAAKEAAWTAVLALIAWDDYGYLLEENPENVKILALLGNHAAVLLYPACVALQNTKELEMV